MEAVRAEKKVGASTSERDIEQLVVWVTALPKRYQHRSRGVFPHTLESCWTSVVSPSIPAVLCNVCMPRVSTHVLKTQFPRLEVTW